MVSEVELGSTVNLWETQTKIYQVNRELLSGAKIFFFYPFSNIIAKKGLPKFKPQIKICRGTKEQFYRAKLVFLFFFSSIFVTYFKRDCLKFRQETLPIKYYTQVLKICEIKPFLYLHHHKSLRSNSEDI